MFKGHNCNVSKQFQNQSELFLYQKFLNSKVSKLIIKPDGNISKPLIKTGESVSKQIMKLKYNKYIYVTYLVPSSRNRPLATSVVAILHPALSLKSSRRFIISLERYFCILSIQVQCGMPLPRRPSIIPSIICNSMISDLTTCPKKR